MSNVAASILYRNSELDAWPHHYYYQDLCALENQLTHKCITVSLCKKQKELGILSLYTQLYYPLRERLFRENSKQSNTIETKVKTEKIDATS